MTMHAELIDFTMFFFSFQYFTGNRDQNTVVQHRFYPPIKALFIKIRPWGWYSRISMRVEFFGCSEGKKSKLRSLSTPFPNVFFSRSCFISKCNKYVEALVRRFHRLVFTGDKTSRGMGPKCIYEVIARHARIVWLDNRQWWRLRHDDLTFKMAVRFSQTIHACVAVAFQTQDSTQFATAKLCLRYEVNSARVIFSSIWLHFSSKS